MTRTRRRTAITIVGASVLVAACGSSAEDAASDAAEDGAAVEDEGVQADTTEPTDPAAAPVTTPPPPPSTSDEQATTTTAPPPATTAAPAPVDTVDTVDLGPAPGCRRLTDFDAGLGDWLVVNDGVMGGRSEGFVDVDASLMRFDGTIVTAGGGFTSVRRRLDGGELSGTTRVEMRIRSDDRRYAVILESDERVDGRAVSYRAELDPLVIDDDGFAVVSAVYADMDTSIFGFRVEAAPFDAEAGREIGIIISDGIDGDFTLDVDWVDVCAD